MSSRAQTVLVVDDEPDILDSLVDLLRSAFDRLEVVAASSGPAALRCMRERRIDLILTDYKMPGMNGLDLLRAARGVAPNVPRILVTAFPDLDVAVRALNEEGIDHFFTKPLDAEQVIDGIRRVLAESEAQAAPGRALASGFGEARRTLAQRRGSDPSLGTPANGR